MADSLRRMLAPVYQPLFNELFDRPKPSESRATCSRCAMANHGDPSPVPMEYFLSDVKCCTYFPQLPNYLVGAILSDPGPDMEEGKRRIRERIATRIGVIPHWLTRPAKMTHIMQAYGPSFGRARTLLCPYFDTNNLEASCTIWRHREVVCSTYFCKYEGGQRGYNFWTAFKDYLFHVQRHLARNAQVAIDKTLVDPPPVMKNSLTPEEIDDLPPKEADYAKYWGQWLGREEEFYIKSYEWLKQLSMEDFRTNVDGTQQGKPIIEKLTAAYEQLENRILPKSLVRSARMKEDHTPDKVVVTTYHRYDSFALDKDLYDVVGRFRANQTVEENLLRLAQEDGVELEPTLIEYLFAAGVLVEPTVPRSPQATAQAEEVAGRRQALTTILNARGLEVPYYFQKKLDTADVKTIDRWLQKAANANNIRDVIGSVDMDDESTDHHGT